MRAYALVDDEDHEELDRWRWSLSSNGCHARRGTRERGTRRYIYVSMHAQIMGFPSCPVDHEDGNGLNNQRGNLRLCVRGQRDNMQNRGANRKRDLPRGVAWHRAASKYRARATVNGRDYHLGLFGTVGEADVAARTFRAEHMPFSEDARAA